LPFESSTLFNESMSRSPRRNARADEKAWPDSPRRRTG
jgi:hypothetical protein